VRRQETYAFKACLEKMASIFLCWSPPHFVLVPRETLKLRLNTYANAERLSWTHPIHFHQKRLFRNPCTSAVPTAFKGAGERGLMGRFHRVHRMDPAGFKIIRLGVGPVDCGTSGFDSVSRLYTPVSYNRFSDEHEAEAGSQTCHCTRETKDGRDFFPLGHG